MNTISLNTQIENERTIEYVDHTVQTSSSTDIIDTESIKGNF